MSHSFNTELIFKELPWLREHFEEDRPEKVTIKRADNNLLQQGIREWNLRELFFGFVSFICLMDSANEKIYLFSKEGVLLGAVGQKGVPKNRTIFESIFQISCADFSEDVRTAIERISMGGAVIAYVAYFEHTNEEIEPAKPTLTIYKPPKTCTFAEFVVGARELERENLTGVIA